jgi:hypothetical protein
MPLSQTTKTDLQRELVDLKQVRESLDDRITAIEAVLVGEAVTRTVRAKATVNDEREAPAKTKAGPRKKRRSKRLGPTISDIVQRTPGVRSGQVTRILMDEGFVLRGKTPLRKRVYEELRKLTKRGSIRRDSERGYVPVTTSEVQTETAV